ncbi:MAG: EAL domain-containing protein [Actinobacteria bacterium]|nr:MAG: EAL domain-containing protein [Actinomycetota bacterium]
MYKAKARGRSRTEIATKAVHTEVESRLSTELALRRSLSRDEFDVLYQPVVAIDGGGLIGVEALVRWRRPDHGLVEPDAFIGIAEDTGLIRPLGAWVLHQACRQLHHWSRVGVRGGVVSVNLSGRQLTSPDLVGNVLGAIATAGIDPSQLSFEITESVLMEDVDRSIQIRRAGDRRLRHRLLLAQLPRTLPGRHPQDRPELHLPARFGRHRQRHRLCRHDARSCPWFGRHRRRGRNRRAAPHPGRPGLRRRPGLPVRPAHPTVGPSGVRQRVEYTGPGAQLRERRGAMLAAWRTSS